MDTTTHEQLNTKAAAFETVNGESILVYYNPNCEPDLAEIQGTQSYYTQPKLCANFVYDLNGKKGPNTVGKDIGFITALYSTDPVVAAPNFYSGIAAKNVDFESARNACKQISEDAKIPNIDELTSAFVNKFLLDSESDISHWSGTAFSAGKTWALSFTSGRRMASLNSETYRARCIKR